MINQCTRAHQCTIDGPCNGFPRARRPAASKPAAPVGWRLNVGQSDERIWLTVTTPHGATASLSCADRNDNGRTIQGQVLMALKEALDAPAAPSVEQDERGALDELSNIANAKRFDRETFADDTEFADWAQNRARHTLRAASTSANVEPAVDAQPVAIYQVQTGDCWLDMTKEQFDNHSKSRPTRIVYAAPPAQTALTDDARECLMDVVSHHHDFRTACIEIKAANETTRSDELYWQKQIDVLDRMKAQAERALTTAQSASVAQ
jgi:hypothetical protein